MPSAIARTLGRSVAPVLAAACLALAPVAAAQWSDVGYVSDPVYALAVATDGTLYAGGGFTRAGDVTAWHVARWDGASWSALGSGLNGTVASLCLDAEGNLYVGGSFTTAGGISANNIAKWDGSRWSALGSGTGSSVEAIAVDGSGNVYAAGMFGTAGGRPANAIAKWNGSSWSTLGSGVNGILNTLAVDRAGNVFAGGLFSTAGGVIAANVARWDGSRWWPLGSGTNDHVHSLAFDAAGRLVAGGSFTVAGGTPAPYVARWGGASWSALGSELTKSVYDLDVDASGDVYAGGFPLPVDNLVSRWDGSAWSPLGGEYAGTNGTVYALRLAPSGLYVGGQFTLGGGPTATHIARYDFSPSAKLTSTAAASTDISPIPVVATFSEAVSGFDLADLVITNGSASNLIEVVPGRSWSFHVTPSAYGTVAVALPADVVRAVSDADGNLAAAPLTRTWVADATPPQIAYIARSGGSPTNVASVSFRVVFTEAVTGVDAADFVLAPAGAVAGTIAGVSGSGADYTVTVGEVTGNGTLGLDVSASPTVADGTGNPLAGPYSGGDPYVIDTLAPSVDAIDRAGPTPTSASSVVFDVLLSEQVTGLDVADFALTLTGTATGSIASLTGSGSGYVVTVDGVGGDGTLRLDLIASPSGVDAAGNALAGPFAGQEYTVAPTRGGDPAAPAGGCGCGSSGPEGLSLAAAILALLSWPTRRRASVD